MPQQMTLFSAEPLTQKELGAYYTDEQVADFLVTWAVRSPTDCVLDPGFGDGAFLKSACQRISALGGTPSTQVLGLEVNSQVHATTSDVLAKKFAVPPGPLRCGDFFDEPPAVFQMDAVVGNPPFIRYQRFSGKQRTQALLRARSQGVRLSELTSSWAPFLIHAISMVKSGGRLAMVAPFELSHAAYARPVIQHLISCFSEVILLTFRQKLFHQLNEDTLLVLASGKGAGPCQLILRDLHAADDLTSLFEPDMPLTSTIRIEGSEILDHESISYGKKRLINYFLPRNIRELYEELKTIPKVFPLGELATVGIGYVTGANDFFHLGPSTAKEWGIPETHLRPAVRRGRALTGIRFTLSDWKSNLASGETAYLVLVNDDSGPLPPALVKYLEYGERLGIHKAFKCRTRSPWYKVPHVYQPDAFLTYMSGAYPKLVTNTAAAVGPNNLHIVRTRDSGIKADCLSTLWLSSLTGLSAQIEGHSLGGGMLKIEPTEAKRILVPVIAESDLAELCDEVDAMCRTGNSESAKHMVDVQVLQKRMGLSRQDCELLCRGARILIERRAQRGRGKAVCR